MKKCKCKNTVEIVAGWSYFCFNCGRYTYDWDGNVQNKKTTIDNLQTCLETRPTEQLTASKDLIKACIVIARLKKVK